MSSIAAGIAAVMPSLRASGLLKSRCTIQYHDGSLIDGGQLDPAGWRNLTGHVNIPCMDAPSSVGRISATRTDTIESTVDISSDHVLLDAYYPQIETAFTAYTSRYLRAVIDGVALKMIGAESDSQRIMTRLAVEAGAM